MARKPMVGSRRITFCSAWATWCIATWAVCACLPCRSQVPGVASTRWQQARQRLAVTDSGMQRLLRWARAAQPRGHHSQPRRCWTRPAPGHRPRQRRRSVQEDLLYQTTPPAPAPWRGAELHLAACPMPACCPAQRHAAPGRRGRQAAALRRLMQQTTLSTAPAPALRPARALCCTTTPIAPCAAESARRHCPLVYAPPATRVPTAGRSSWPGGLRILGRRLRPPLREGGWDLGSAPRHAPVQSLLAPGSVLCATTPRRATACRAAAFASAGRCHRARPVPGGVL